MKTPFELFHIECGKGWYPLLIPVFNQLKLEGEVPTQVKEKYGTLRIYVSGGSALLYAMIDDAEKRSSIICEVCGAPGKLVGNRWLKTRCEKCLAL